MRSLHGLGLAAALLLLAPLTGRGPLAAQARPAAAPVNVDWRILAGLDYESGRTTDTLKKLDGKLVRVPGFIVPLDDATEEGAEFLLVPYYGACVHTPPPPPNQMALVQMSGSRAVRLGLFDAIWMEGTLRIKNVDSPYGQVGFAIEGLTMKPYTGR